MGRMPVSEMRRRAGGLRPVELEGGITSWVGRMGRGGVSREFGTGRQRSSGAFEREGSSVVRTRGASSAGGSFTLGRPLKNSTPNSSSTASAVSMADGGGGGLSLIRGRNPGSVSSATVTGGNVSASSGYGGTVGTSSCGALVGAGDKGTRFMSAMRVRTVSTSLPGGFESPDGARMIGLMSGGGALSESASIMCSTSCSMGTGGGSVRRSCSGPDGLVYVTRIEATAASVAISMLRETTGMPCGAVVSFASRGASSAGSLPAASRGGSGGFLDIKLRVLGRRDAPRRAHP